jgi:hypothetical protein
MGSLALEIVVAYLRFKQLAGAVSRPLRAKQSFERIIDVNRRFRRLRRPGVLLREVA